MVADSPRAGLARLPDAITASRPLFGLASGVAVATGHAALGGWLYLGGFLTDVADGWLARRLGVQSDQGTARDGRADVAFHAFVCLGLAVAAVVEHSWWMFVVLGAGWIPGRVTKGTVEVHTVLGKAVGGLYRLVLFSLFVVLAQPGQRVVLATGAAVIFGVTYVYETKVTLAELRTGERAMR